MGKIRVKSFGDQEEEKKQERKIEARKAKKAEKLAAKEKEEAVEEIQDVAEIKTEDKVEEIKEVKKVKQQKDGKLNPHSQKYNSLAEGLDKEKVYNLKEALTLLSKLQRNKFDETVELHVNTTSGGISGSITLPHGTGKKTRVAVADEKLISEVEKGTINFDILVAEPSMMVKLAKVAKVLGPRGLMPNPKNGTISANPTELVKKFEAGQVNFKTEKAPIIHLTVGKMSFGDEKLSDNIEALLNAIKKQNIANVTLKSTMSPGIKIRV